MQDKIAVNTITALRMFYNDGFDNELAMAVAKDSLDTLAMPCEGYYYAEDVMNKIEELKCSANAKYFLII